MALPLPQKDKILIAALAAVPELGWSWDAIEQGVKAAKMKPEAAVQAFPDGALDLLAHFADWAEREMIARVQKQRLIHLKVRERVSLCVESWFDVLMLYKEQVKLAMQMSWRPNHGWLATKNMARLCSAIWYECGDNATDFNYYTKRTLLAGVILTTLPVWLRDDSDDQQTTHDFMRDRIDNVLTIGKKMAEFKTIGKSLGGAARFMRKRSA